MTIDIFEKAIQLIKQENKPAAREILVTMIDENPYDELAWWWFAQAHYTKKQQAVILRKGLAVIPDSELLANTLRKLDSQGARVYENSRSVQDFPVNQTDEKSALSDAGIPPTQSSYRIQKDIPTPNFKIQLPPKPGESSQDQQETNQSLSPKQTQAKKTDLNLPIMIPADNNTASTATDSEFFSNLRFHNPFENQPAPKPEHQQTPAPKLSPPVQAPSRKKQLPLYIIAGLTGVVLLLQLVFFFYSMFSGKSTGNGNAAYQDTLAAQQVVGMEESFESEQTPVAQTPAATEGQVPNPDIINASANDTVPGVDPTTSANSTADTPTEIAPSISINTDNQTEAAPATPEATQEPTIAVEENTPTPSPETPEPTTTATSSGDSMAGKLQDLTIIGADPRLPKSLYFISEMNGAPQIYMMDAYGRNLVQITDEPAGVDDFDVSNVDGAIIYVADNQLILLEDNFRNKTILFKGAEPDNSNKYIWTEKITHPVWSDSGQLIAFGHNGINILIVSSGDVQSIITNAPPPQGETSPYRYYTPVDFIKGFSNLLVRVTHEDGETLASYQINTRKLIYVNLNACCQYAYGIDNLHIYMTDNSNGGYIPGVWQVNPNMGNFKSLTFDDDQGTYAWLKQSPFGRLFYFYNESGSDSLGLYSSHPIDMETKTRLLVGEFTIGDALWSDDAYIVVIQDTTSNTMKILRTDDNPPSELPFNGSHFIWGNNKEIDLSFFENVPEKPVATPTPGSTPSTQIEINLDEPIQTEEIIIEEPKMSMVTNLNPDQQLFEQYQGVVFPPYPEGLTLASFTQVSDEFNISVLFDEEKIMVWLGESLDKYSNGYKVSILRDLVAVPENLDKAGFSLGGCNVDGLADPNVFAIGSWQGSFQLAHIEYALWIDHENKQLFPIYRDKIECVMDLLIQEKDNGFNIWNNNQ